MQEDETLVLQETKALDLPWLLRVFLRLRSILVVNGDGSLRRRILRLLESKPVPPNSTTPRDGTVTTDVVLHQPTGTWGRLFVPCTAFISAGAPSLPVIVYFHGGGFTILSADNPVYDGLCRQLARRYDAIVVSVNYRKAPLHRYPTAYDDAFTALTWLKQQAMRPQEGADRLLPACADVSRCFLMGDSAGGNIAHHVAARASNALDLWPVRLAACVLLFPFFGGEERTAAELRLQDAPLINYKMCDVAWREFLPVGSTRDHVAANVAVQGGPDLSGMPPLLVAIGGYDCLKEWQLRYVRHLREAVGEKHVRVLYYPGGMHAFHAIPFLELTDRLLDDVHAFIRTYSGMHEAPPVAVEGSPDDDDDDDTQEVSREGKADHVGCE